MPTHQQVHDSLFPPPKRKKSRTGSTRGDYQYTPEKYAQLTKEWDDFEIQAKAVDPAYQCTQPPWMRGLDWRDWHKLLYPNMPRWQVDLYEWARLERKMGWQWVQDKKREAIERRVRASKARRARHARARRARWCKENLA